MERTKQSFKAEQDAPKVTEGEISYSYRASRLRRIRKIVFCIALISE